MLRRLPSPPRQMNVAQVPLREVKQASDSQSLSQQERVGELEDELTTAFANQLPGRIAGAKVEHQPMGDLAAVAKAVIRQDTRTFETVMATSDAERRQISATLTAGKDRLLRVLLHKGQARTQMPKPARPHFPETEIDKSSAGHRRYEILDTCLRRPKKL